MKKVILAGLILASSVASADQFSDAQYQMCALTERHIDIIYSAKSEGMSKATYVKAIAAAPQDKLTRLNLKIANLVYDTSASKAVVTDIVKTSCELTIQGARK